ncbi:hypothetical protein SprV_0301041200 [Sparganum proliferum]
MRLPPSSWDHGHDLRNPPTSGEVSVDADPPALYLRGSVESLRHAESRRTVLSHKEIRLSGVIHSDLAPTPPWHDGASHGQWSCLRGIHRNQRVKQGCVLAHTLFNLMFATMLVDAYRDERRGIRIVYRTDSQSLKHRRMHFQSRVSAISVHELLFAYTCLLSATSEVNNQTSMDLFAATCENFCLVTNTEKMVVMHQPPPDADHNAPQINVNGAQL